MEAVIKSVKIAGMQAAVPSHRHSFVETPEFFTQEEANKIYQSTGIYSRRILPTHLCASDMCIMAAEELLQKLNWDPKSVDVLIYVSQDSDYPLPATACLMQSRLGLASTSACLDISLGCSGFVYATWLASQLLNSSNGKKALVLCGDTSSRHLLPNDKSTKPLFGDAGVATALEFDPAWPDSYAIFGTDGTGGQHIAVPAGGRRIPTIPEQVSWDNMIQQDLFTKSRLHLNGAAVFSFTLKIVPKLIKEVLELADITKDELDMCVMHQANGFILEHLRKKTAIAKEKYLIDMKDFGNTSSASIPLAICHKLNDYFDGSVKKILLAGFGVGWSWGAIILNIGTIPKPEISEIKDDFKSLQLTQ